jgi:hypothetical protein
LIQLAKRLNVLISLVSFVLVEGLSHVLRLERIDLSAEAREVAATRHAQLLLLKLVQTTYAIDCLDVQGKLGIRIERAVAGAEQPLVKDLLVEYEVFLAEGDIGAKGNDRRYRASGNSSAHVFDRKEHSTTLSQIEGNKQGHSLSPLLALRASIHIHTT